MATIKLKLKKLRKKDDLLTIVVYVRIKEWGRPLLLSTQIYTEEKKWDAEAQKIRGRGEEIKKTNLILMQKKTLAAEIITDYSLMKRELTIRRFQAEFKNPTLRGDFIGYWEKKIDENYNRGLFNSDTLKTEKRSLRKVKDFSLGELSFSEVNRSWLEKFDEWHTKSFKDSQHKGARERERVLKHIKKYLSSARGEIDGVKIPKPFEGFKWPKYSTSPVALSEDELILMIEFYREPDKILEQMIRVAKEREMFDWNIEQYANESGVQRIRRIMRKFIFQSITGMRFGDLIKLEYQNFENGYLMFQPEKTAESSGKTVKMVVTKLMEEIIEEGEGTVFNKISNVKYNKYLKEVASILKIKKRLTTHVGRHTFATMGIDKGIPLPILADLMGLASIKTLMIYVHTNQKMADKYLKKAWKGIGTTS